MGCAYFVALFRPDPHYRVLALDKLCSKHREQYCYFFAAAVLILTKLYGNYRYKIAIYISLPCPDITI
jgi:hypothetical protein